MRRKKHTGEELNLLYREAEAHFMKIPGVIGVGFGLKEKAGKIIDERAFRIYVKDKKPLSAIPDNEKIPDSYKGIKTDIILSFNDELIACEDTNHYNSIVGGITITDNDDFLRGGTLGCLTIIRDENSKDNIGILSNKHVMNGSVNDSVFHPFFEGSGATLTINNAKSKNEGIIAKIYNEGKADNVDFHYPQDAGTSTNSYYIDCALARVTTSHSSCCPTNCGTKYSAEIQDIGPIRGVRRIQPSDVDPANPIIVKKRGRRTGLTQGRIIDVNATYDTSNPKHGAILIAPIEDNCEGLQKFGDHGDSGSVVLNGNDEVIGLLYSMPGVPATSPFFGYGIACHIHPVLDFLKTTIITTPVSNASQRKRNIEPQNKNVKLKTVEDLKQAFINKNEHSEKLYQIFEKYRGEVANLVNHSRPVTVVWHRNNGPRFVAHFIKNFNEPDYKVPFVINDVSLTQLLLTMRNILDEYGSKGLKDTIDLYGDSIIKQAADCDNLETLLFRLSNSK